MNSKIASVKLNERLEKADSHDYDNITKYQKEEAVNKAALDFVRSTVKGEDEVSRFKIDDLQFLLKEKPLSFIDKGIYIESFKIPDDYLFFKKLTPKCSKGLCSDVTVVSHLMEVANEDDLLSDYNSQPSFDFEQTFHTIMGNRFKVFHNNDFTIDTLSVIYYRRPVNISFADKDLLKTWEFKDDLAEVILDIAANILSGDTGNQEAYQVSGQRIATNK